MAEFNGASISHGKDQSNKIMLLSICYIRYVRRELI